MASRKGYYHAPDLLAAASLQLLGGEKTEDVSVYGGSNRANPMLPPVNAHNTILATSPFPVNCSIAVARRSCAWWHPSILTTTTHYWPWICVSTWHFGLFYNWQVSYIQQHIFLACFALADSYPKGPVGSLPRGCAYYLLLAPLSCGWMWVVQWGKCPASPFLPYKALKAYHAFLKCSPTSLVLIATSIP